MPTLPQKPKRTPKKQPRKHVPALPKFELDAALQRLQELDIAAASKGILADTIRAAANPEHGSPAAIVRSLPHDRQAMITKTANRMKSIGDDVMARGKKRLLEMSEDEWNALIEDE